MTNAEEGRVHLDPSIVIPRCTGCRAPYRPGELFCRECDEPVLEGLFIRLVTIAGALGFGLTLLFGTLGANVPSAWQDAAQNLAVLTLLMVSAWAVKTSWLAPERPVLEELGAIFASRTLRLAVLLGTAFLVGNSLSIAEGLGEAATRQGWYPLLVWYRLRIILLLVVTLAVLVLWDQGLAFFDLRQSNVYEESGRGVPYGASAYPHFLYVRIPLDISPLERGERFQFPLDDALSAAELGQVTGGGTNGAPGEVGIEIDVMDVQAALPIVRDILLAAGAPEATVIESDEGTFPLRG